jgi:hypothetical protein
MGQEFASPIDHALVDLSAQTRSSDRSRRRLRGRVRRRERFARAAHAAHDRAFALAGMGRFVFCAPAW